MRSQLTVVALIIASSIASPGCIGEDLWEAWDVPLGQSCAEDEECKRGFCIDKSDGEGLCSLDCQEGRCPESSACLEVHVNGEPRSLCFKVCDRYADYACSPYADCLRVGGEDLCVPK